jgi:hypothetical protein
VERTAEKILKYNIAVSVINKVLRCSYFSLFQKEDFDSEDDKSPEEKYVEEMSKIIPQGTDKTPEVLDSALQGLSARSVSHE